MSSQQIQGAVRTFLAFVGGLLASKSIIDIGDWNEMSGAGVALAIAVWSWWSKRKDG